MRSTDAQGTYGNAPLKNKKELQAFLGIINYLGKYCPSTSNMCEPVQKLMSSKTLWTWNALYQTLFNKAKSLIKDDVCMKFYDETKHLYLETNGSGIGLEASLLQTRDGATCPRDVVSDNTILRPIAFASKGLTSME